MNGISIFEKKIKKYVVKFEIIWMRIGQIIRLQNDIDFSEMCVWEEQSHNVILVRAIYLKCFNINEAISGQIFNWMINV